MSTERSINANIKTHLLSNEPLQYAHLVKFERPFDPDPLTGKFRTNKERYAYFTDAAHDISYNDGTTDQDGNSNGAMTYRANRVLKIGNYSETTIARATSLKLTLAGEDLGAAVSLNGALSTATVDSVTVGRFTPTSTIYEGEVLDFTEKGFKEGDLITFTNTTTSAVDSNAYTNKYIITLSSANSQIKEGAIVTGTGIGTNTKVVSIDSATLTLDKLVSVSSGATLTFENSNTYFLNRFRTNNTVLEFSRTGDDSDDSAFLSLTDDFTISLKSQEVTSILEDRQIEAGAISRDTSLASPSFLHRQVFVYKVFIDPDDGSIIGNTSILVFKGIVASSSLSEDGTNTIVDWSVTSHWGDFEGIQGRLTTDETHRSLDARGKPNIEQGIRPEYAGDLGFLHSETSLSAIAIYNTKGQGSKLKSKRRGGFAGLTGQKYYVTETWEYDIQNEVDLNIHLQGKHLPVVYGVQRLNSVPIFADTLNSDSKKVYTADAICEGEIHGVYNIYIDDVPLICTDDNDYDIRNATNGTDTDNTQLQCYGNMSKGDTLNGHLMRTAPYSTADEQRVMAGLSPSSATMAGTHVPLIGTPFSTGHQDAVEDSAHSPLKYRSVAPQNIQGLTASTEGLNHDESYKINLGDGGVLSSTMFTGQANQKACDSLVTPAENVTKVMSVTITNPGDGYTSAPTGVIDAPDSGGTQATIGSITLGTAENGETDVLGNITVNNHGTGYAPVDTPVGVTFSGGGGSGGAAVANLGGYKRQNDYYDGNLPYWGPAHRLLDTAYVATSFELNADQTSLPEIEYIVKGKVLECHNYDNTYLPDPSVTSAAHTNFVEGSIYTVEYSSDGSSWTTDTTGTWTNNKFKILDKYEFTNHRGVTTWRFRLDTTPALGGATPTQTRLRLKNGNDYWYMITWNHAVVSTETAFPDEWTTATLGVASGKLTATVADATAGTPALNTYTEFQFYNADWYDDYSHDYDHTKGLKYGVLKGTWSGNTITFDGTDYTGISSFGTNKIRPADAFDLSSVSAVANITNTGELYSGRTTTQYHYLTHAATSQTEHEIGARLINETTGEWREIIGFNTTTDVVTIETPFFTPPLTTHKFTISGRGKDLRASSNPAIQTLDYLTSKRYGKGADLAEDVDLSSFISAAKLCDSRSNIQLKVESITGIAEGDIFTLTHNGASDGTHVASGKVAAGGIDASGNTITLTQVINKFAKRYSTYTSLNTGDIVYTDAGAYYRATADIATPPSTVPSHGSQTTVANLLHIGNYDDNVGANPIVVHKTSGSGSASTLNVQKRQGTPVEYSLYDSDWVKYWKYYGWDHHHQREVTRHQTNFILDTGKSVFANMNALLSHFNGILSYENGKYTLDVETQMDAPTISLNANQENINPYYIENSDIIGRISLKDNSSKKAKNTVKASIADPQNNFGSRSITFFNSDFLKADRNIVKNGQFPFTGITNYYNGRIGAEKELYQSRFSKEISFTVGSRGLLLKAGQVIAITYDPFGWSSKLFRIDNLSFQANCNVSVKATEYDDSIYEITKQQFSNVMSQSSASYTLPIPPKPTDLDATTDKNGSIIITWKNGVSDNNAFDERTDSTEIWYNSSDDRDSSTLLATVDNSTSYTFTSTVAENKYFWIRHKRMSTMSKGSKTGTIHSAWNASAGELGTSLSISAGATSVKLLPSSHVIDWNKEASDEQSTINFTTDIQGMSGTLYYDFLVGATSKQNTTTSTWTLPDADEPGPTDAPIKITVKVRQGSTSGTLLAQDVVSIYAIQDGQNTVTGILTNESHTVPTNSDGSGASFTGAGGTYLVYYGNDKIQDISGYQASDLVFSVQGTTGTVTAAINATTGVYSISALSSDVATVTFRAIVKGSMLGGLDTTNDVTRDKIYTISRAKAGVSVTGTSNALVYAYQRSSSALTSDAGDVTVALTGTDAGKITTSSLANDWEKEIPSGTDDLYVIAATASGTGATDTIAASEWTDPVQLGASGLAGLNSATVQLWQATATDSEPSAGSNNGKPEGNATYTFATSTLGAFATNARSWSTVQPSVSSTNKYIWTITATASSNTATDVIPDSEWSDITKLVQPGASGTDAKTVHLAADDYSIIYDGNGANPEPSGNITLTATAINFTDPYFKFTTDGTAEGNYSDGSGATDTKTFAIPSTKAAFGTDSKVMRVGVADADQNELAYDTINIYAVQDGTDALTVILANDAVALPADDTGAISSYNDSGTTIEVLQGGSTLDYIASGTAAAGEYKVTAVESQTSSTDDLTVDQTPTDTSDGVTFGNVSGWRATDQVTASITFTVAGKDLAGNNFSVVKKQTFTQIKAGASGTLTTKVIYKAANIAPSAPSADGLNVPSGWSEDPNIARTLPQRLYQSTGTISSGAYVWGTPKNANEGEHMIFRQSAMPDGSSTYEVNKDDHWYDLDFSPPLKYVAMADDAAAIHSTTGWWRAEPDLRNVVTLGNNTLPATTDYNVGTIVILANGRTHELVDL